MGRKIVSLILALALMVAVPTMASAVTVYEDGNISSTYSEIMKDVLSKVSPFKDYVFFRSGQYEYSLYVGDLECAGGVFTSSDYVEVYVLQYSSSGYNSSSYSYGYAVDTGFTLNVGDNLVYSNLDIYPDLIERSVYVETYIALLLLVALSCYLLHSVFKWCLRK